MSGKPPIGEMVLYNHPGSADGKYKPTQSPAIIRDVRVTLDGITEAQLFVFGPKGQHQDWASEGTGPCQWQYRV